MMQKGMVHIYTGDGKGKTSASVGLTLRAFGSGLKCAFISFLKGTPSGEVEMLEKLGVTVLKAAKNDKFFFQMTEEEKKDCINSHVLCYNKGKTMIASGEYDVVVFDEMTHAVNLGLISLDDLCAFLDSRPCGVEIVMTGRDADEALIKRADYVSDIRAVSHPFDKGAAARKGIEF